MKFKFALILKEEPHVVLCVDEEDLKKVASVYKPEQVSMALTTDGYLNKIELNYGQPVLAPMETKLLEDRDDKVLDETDERVYVEAAEDLDKELASAVRN